VPYIIRCDCGTDMKNETEEKVLADGVVHAKDEHALTVTPDQLRQFVELVDV
jgi:predicted small metal-binding protein